MTRPIVVTGTDTDVGKTVFAAALVAALKARYWKPIQTGLDDGDDSLTVARLSGIERSRIEAEAYRLHAPAAPHRASELDGVSIDIDRLRPPAVDGPLVIEGAGGVLVPVTRELSYAALFALWGFPVVLVARTALGTINHSLLSIEALRARGVEILGIAYIGAANEDSEQTIATVGKVKRLGRLPMLPKLGRAELAAAFAENFSLRDFAT